MAESPRNPYDRDVVSLQKTAFIAAAVVTTCLALSALVLATVAWKKLHAPMTTNITNNEYKNQSQWQATVVFPNGGVPIDIEHFVYNTRYEVSSRFPGNPEEVLRVGQAKIDELKNRCLWWLESSMPGDYRNTAKIITCFKEKQKK